ncbi:MAG: OmpA family protein [Candidatus Omnitrophica bacterium]|nr:OmpA family protein [Candidatus Omnitrophota bacterium]MDD5574498.1 OmpA family protein [Candidatus Omnitrophota bacterium]
MRHFIFVVLAVLVVCSSGCASSGTRPTSDKDLPTLAQRFEMAKKENTTLKNELTLYRNEQRLDARRFLGGVDVFEKAFSQEVKDGQVELRVSDKGLVITVLAEKLFISGSAALSDEGKAFLDRILEVMSMDFAENYIYVDGHTDNQSLAVFEWKSDWEFSFARALGVVQYFKEKGVDPLRLSASGFGQYRPRASNETKEGRRLNRRIEIIISPQRVGHVVE